MTIDEIRDQTPGRFHWLGLPPSYEASMRFPGTREQIAQACLEAVRKSRFGVRRSDLAGGWVEARARVSFRSYSENIRVFVDDENRVHVTSECYWPLTVIDWGKNRWNVRRILANLTLILGAPY
ncbi:MAG TPA: hypothetical protein VGI96_34255 [Streptosporangiaceae bacterium]|jgi:hypothetical protein